MVNWSASIKRPFLDIKNLLIGLILSILPVVRWFAQGYALEHSGLTKKKVPIDKSPEWSDWGGMFVRGLLASLISIIYLLPAILMFLLGAFSLLSIIFSVIGWSALVKGDSAVISQIIEQNWNLILPALMVSLPFILMAIVLAIFAEYLIPAAQMNFLHFNSFNKAFSFREVFSKAFTSKYLVAWLLVLLIAIVVGLVLGWIPFVGNAAVFFIGSVIAYTVYGQVYKEIKK